MKLSLNANNLNNTLKVLNHTFNNEKYFNLELNNDNNKTEFVTKNKRNDLITGELKTDITESFDFHRFDLKPFINSMKLLEGHLTFDNSDKFYQSKISETENETDLIIQMVQDQRIKEINLNDFEEIENITVNAIDFLNAIEEIKAGLPSNDNMPIILNIKVELKEAGLNLISCDGFRLFTRHINSSYNGNEIDFFIHKETVKSLIQTIKRVKQIKKKEFDPLINIKLYKDNERLFTEYLINEFSVISESDKGDYIDYTGIFPNNSETEIKVNRKDFLKKVEKIKAFNNGSLTNDLIKITLDKETLLAANNDNGEIQCKLKNEFTGKNLKIAFNAKFIIDVLKNIKDEEIECKFTSSVGPMEILSKNGHDLVLPVRLAE